MNFTVSLDGGENLELSTSLPAKLLHYQSLPLVYTASGQWGTAIFQALAADGFEVWYSRYFIKENTCLHIEAPTKTIALHLAFKNKLDIVPAGMEPIQLKEKQFNLSYFPAIDMKLRFKPGKYARFDIHFSQAYLQQFIPDIPGLDAFLNHTEKGNGRSFCPNHLYASPQMLAGIKQVLQFKFDDAVGRRYIEYQAPMLLLLASREMGKEKERRFVLTEADRALMEKVKTWLLENPYTSCGLADIARKFVINEYKLKRDFKAAFGTTVFDLLLQVRLQNAEKLVLETNLPITQIAYITGYSAGAHFSDAFKKRFGYPPNYLRSRNKPGV